MPFELPAGYEEQEPIPLSKQLDTAEQPDIDIDTSRVEDDEEDQGQGLSECRCEFGANYVDGL